MAGHDWEREAVCATADPEAFFPTAGDSGQAALDICWDHCPVREACLEAAMAEEHPTQRRHSGRHGIRGGYTPNGRAQLQRQRTAAANRATPTPTN